MAGFIMIWLVVSFWPAGVAKERAEQYKGKSPCMSSWLAWFPQLVGLSSATILESQGVLHPWIRSWRSSFPAVYRKKNYQSKSNYCKYDNQGLSAFNVFALSRRTGASIGASTVTRKYGRRISIICGDSASFTEAALNLELLNLAMLLLRPYHARSGSGLENQATIGR
ncbi:sugar transport protein 7 [Cinnamomum micranthum f. kanehirae]|uniref:Sugar transport protein 7 n=1 Tax=Cinnamomum micranthum f. kanehirae TaxID=337451 RepID=A0A443Q584_9MAGN|nr:sugar transport protein 7 [Cinnamomum micranthum f. kanehirae]